MNAARRAWLDANKAHMSAYSKARWPQYQAAMQLLATRFCRTCQTEKPSAAFYPSYKSQCRACLKAKAAPTQPDKRVYVREWARQNPEKLKAWFDDNREHRLQYGRELYARNEGLRKRRAEFHAAWAKRNTHLMRSYAARRDAAKLKATPPWADSAEIVAFYVKAVQLTQETGIKHEVDHIVPLRNKLVCGLHCAHNLQVLTRVENRQKANHFTQPHVNLPQSLCAEVTR